MKRLSNTKAGLKKSVAYKKSVYLVLIKSFMLYFENLTPK